MAFRNNVALSLLVMITVMDWHANALRADMKRVHGSSMTSSQRLSAAVHRSSARLRKIETSVTGKAADTDLAAPVNRGKNVGEFLGRLDIQEDGSGGFIIDSGSAFSYLIPEAFTLVAEAVDLALGWDRADGSDYGFSLCYQIPQGNTTYVFPDITFIFSRNVPYVVDQKYNFRLVDEKRGLVCMLILEIEETSAVKSPSILGSYQQQNYHILYDIGNYTLSFAPTTCADLLQPAFDQSFLPTESPANSTESPASSTESSGHARPIVLFRLIVAFFISVSLLAICF
ncbi:hypothetical protein SUGI_0337660 [Cryptomeria japonica]|nr:hypothetical protein SUGI_0337660 [Cryptomeria japonica]